MSGAPVVIATNGYGMTVRPVDSGAPVITVAENGFGTPIVISDLGAPFVVEGLTPPDPGVYPLDLITQQPLATYGVMKQRAAYTGPAIRVVRPSDSTTLNIGFIPVTGDLDTDALDAFLGGQTGKVDIWYDQSGNGHHAPQTVDASRMRVGVYTLRGKRCLAANSHFFNLPTSLVTQRNTVNVFSYMSQAHSNTKSAMFDLGSGASIQQSWWTEVVNARGNLRTSPAGGTSTFSATTSDALMEFRWLSSGQDNEFRAFGDAGAATLTGGMLGNIANASGYEAKAFFGTTTIFATPLGTEDRAAYRAALYAQFGGVEAKSSTLVFQGDSITVGSDEPLFDGYARQAVAALPNTVRAFNLSGGGNQVQTTVGYYANQAGSLFSRYSTEPRVLYLAYGTNDIVSGSRTAAQVIADLEAYAALARASGAKVVCGTILPRIGLTGPQETTRTDVNAAIRASAAFDVVSDVAAHPVMGAAGAESNTALYNDGLHPTRLGHSYLAPVAAAAITAAFAL